MIQVLVADANTFNITEELPWRTVSFEHRLNDIGSWQVTLPLSFEVNGYEKMSTTTMEANRSIVYILRDGVVQFGGWFEAEDASIDDSGESLTIGGPEVVCGYLAKRVMYGGWTYTNVDQFSYVRAVTAEENVPNGIGITVLAEPTNSGVLRQGRIIAAERNGILELVEQMAAREDGFDFTGLVTGDQSSGFEHRLLIGYPYLRRQTGFVLGLNKNMTLLSYKKDASKFATYVSVQGAGSGDELLVASAEDTTTLGLYPQIDRVERRSTVIQQDTLQSYADQYLDLYSRPQEFIEVAVNPNDTDSAIGSFRVGDEFRVIARRGRLDIDDTYRVNAWSYAVDVNGKEDMSMTMTGTARTS